MKSGILLLFFLAATKIAKAQSVSTLMGARAAGISYASSVLPDEWSLFNNPGGLAGIEKTNVAFTYDLQGRIAGANRMACVFSIPLKTGVMGSGFFRFGDPLYSEQIVTAGYGNRFGIAALGVKVNYVQYRAEGYGTKSAATISLGGIADLTPHLSIGMYAVNINQPRLSDNGERIPTRLVAGLGFKPTDKVLLVTEVEKDLEYDAVWKAGLEYVLHKKIAVRTGFNIHPNAAFFGLGFQTRKLKIDYAVQYSTTLNFSYQASVVYLFLSRRQDEQ
jgi:hypothetical protein